MLLCESQTTSEPRICCLISVWIDFRVSEAVKRRRVEKAAEKGHRLATDTNNMRHCQKLARSLRLLRLLQPITAY